MLNGFINETGTGKAALNCVQTAFSPICSVKDLKNSNKGQKSNLTLIKVLAGLKNRDV